MSGEGVVNQIISDLYSSKVTNEDILKKYNIPKTEAGLILKIISQDPEILRDHHILMVEKPVNKNDQRKALNRYYLSPIPLEIQIFDLTFGISLLNFKDFFLKYDDYLNYSSDDTDLNTAIENSAAYLNYDKSEIQNQLLPNTRVIISNISPFILLDDLEIIENLAYKIQEPDRFLSRYFNRRKDSVVGICIEFFKAIENIIKDISDPKEFPIFYLQTGMKYLSWAIRYYEKKENSEISFKLKQISEELFKLLFIPPNQLNFLSLENTDLLLVENIDSALLGNIDSSNNPSVDLIKNLKFLGIEAKSAYLLDVLLHNNEVTISKFKNNKQIKGTLNILIKNGIVISYNRMSKINNRNVKYYRLNKSPQQIYEYLKSRCQNKSTELMSVFDKANLLYIKESKFDEAVKSLSIIGIEVNAAKILVFLELNPSSPSKAIIEKSGISNISLTDILRRLYEVNWIIANEIGHVSGHSDKRYSLNTSLYDIILGYLLNHLEKTKHSLESIDKIFSNLETFEPLNTDELVKAPKKVQEEGYNFILSCLEPYLISHSNLKKKSFVVEFKPPYPKSIRIYLTDMRLSFSKDTYLARLLFDNKRGEIWNFNQESVSYVLLCGYIAEFNMFVLYDTSFYRDVAYGKMIDIPVSAIYEARVHSHVSKNVIKGNEIIIIVPPEKFLNGLEQRYDIYLQQLLSE